MKKIITAGLVGLSMSVSGLAMAEPIKVGLITTLSGGGAGLGIDVRDAFLLAIERAGKRRDRGHRRRRRPAARNGRPDRRPHDPERAGRHSHRHHLVEPGHGRRAERGCSRMSSTSRPTPAPPLWPAQTAIRTTSTRPTRTTICTRRWGRTPTKTISNMFIMGAELSGGNGLADRLQALLRGRTDGMRSTPRLARRTMRAKSRRFARPVRMPSSPSCRAAWALRS